MNAPRAQAAGPETEAPRVRPCSVMIVEDESWSREVLEILLVHLGHRVVGCADGREALRRCHEDGEPIDVVLMDVQMPGLDGLETTRRLRADHRTREVAIVCVSARAGATIQEESARAGSDCYLTKPIHEDQVFRAVTEVLRRRGRLAADEVFA